MPFIALTEASTKEATAPNREDSFPLAEKAKSIPTFKHRICLYFWFLFDTEYPGMLGVLHESASSKRHLRSKIR